MLLFKLLKNDPPPRPPTLDKGKERERGGGALIEVTQPSGEPHHLRLKRPLHGSLCSLEFLIIKCYATPFIDV